MYMYIYIYEGSVENVCEVFIVIKKDVKKVIREMKGFDCCKQQCYNFICL